MMLVSRASAQSIIAPMDPFQLYDLTRDLAEAEDLANSHPEVVQSLTQQLDKIRKQ